MVSDDEGVWHEKDLGQKMPPVKVRDVLIKSCLLVWLLKVATGGRFQDSNFMIWLKHPGFFFEKKNFHMFWRYWVKKAALSKRKEDVSNYVAFP